MTAPIKRPESSNPDPVEPTSGTCCICGYKGKFETPCLTSVDGVHCDHWWDGADEDYDELGNYVGVLH